ncbi:MAG: hypothetical protein Q4F00_00395 [bacterium]|nr:hypothetical protein [bacterium]
MQIKPIIRRLVLVSVMAVLAMSATAQAVTGNHQAKEIIDSLFGGKGLAPINDLIVEIDCTKKDANTGQMMLASKDKVYFKAPNKLRTDAVIQAPGDPLDQRQLIFIRDGKTACHYLSTGQYPVKKAPDLPSPTSVLPFSLQRYPIDETKSYEFGEQRVLDGVTTREIIIKNPQDPKDERHIFVDPARRVPMLMEFTRTYDKDPVKVTVEYGSFNKLSDGRHFPFLIKIYENGQLSKVYAYKGVNINVGLDDSLFQHMTSSMTQPAR